MIVLMNFICYSNDLSKIWLCKQYIMTIIDNSNSDQWVIIVFTLCRTRYCYPCWYDSHQMPNTNNITITIQSNFIIMYLTSQCFFLQFNWCCTILPITIELTLLFSKFTFSLLSIIRSFPILIQSYYKEKRKQNIFSCLHLTQNIVVVVAYISYIDLTRSGNIAWLCVDIYCSVWAT